MTNEEQLLQRLMYREQECRRFDLVVRAAAKLLKAKGKIHKQHPEAPLWIELRNAVVKAYDPPISTEDLMDLIATDSRPTSN